MKKLIFTSICALTLLSCGRDETEIQSENQSLATTLKSKEVNNSLIQKNADITVYRYYSNSLMKHYYGVSTGPIGPNNWTSEGIAFKTTSSTSGFVYGLALMVNSTNLDMVIATSQNDRTSLEAMGYVYRESLGWPVMQGVPGAVPVYRYYRSSKNGHFYTKDLAELGTGGNGWTYEGIAFYAY